jgi:hypothetical protein
MIAVIVVSAAGEAGGGVAAVDARAVRTPATEPMVARARMPIRE